MDDLISRQAAIDALDKRFDDVPMELTAEILLLRKDLREVIPSAQPEERTNERTETHACDLISRQAALDMIFPYCQDDDGTCSKNGDDLRNLLDDIENLPPTQPEKDVLAWLSAYHMKSFDLNGRYMAHEVIGWLVHDFVTAYMAETREE